MTTKYIRDRFNIDNKIITLPRHRIIYEVFHPNEKIDIINHIDGVRYNNRIENLENVTASENLKKSYVETKTKQTKKCAILQENKILIFFSIADASKYLQCNESLVRSAIKRNGKVRNCKVKIITNNDFNSFFTKGSETIERIIKEKYFNE